MEIEVEQYADRGTVRGADDVLFHARETAALNEDLRLSSSSPKPTRMASRVLATAAVLLLIVAVFAVLRSQRADDIDLAAGSPAAQPLPAKSDGPPDTEPTAEDIERLHQMNATLAEQKANGWIPMSTAVPLMVEGDTMPSQPWVPYSDNPLDVMDVKNDRLPVFDAPAGELVGYLYGGAGFVSLQYVDSGAFDVDAIREAHGLCKQGDMECAKAKMERVEQSANE